MIFLHLIPFFLNACLPEEVMVVVDVSEKRWIWRLSVRAEVRDSRPERRVKGTVPPQPVLNLEAVIRARESRCPVFPDFLGLWRLCVGLRGKVITADLGLSEMSWSGWWGRSWHRPSAWRLLETLGPGSLFVAESVWWSHRCPELRLAVLGEQITRRKHWPRVNLIAAGIMLMINCQAQFRIQGRL